MIAQSGYHTKILKSDTACIFQFLVLFLCAFPVVGEGTKVVDIHEGSEMMMHVPETPPKEN